MIPPPPPMGSDSATITTSPVIDNLIALRILHLLVTPFNEMPAYKMGIIDEKGKVLMRVSQMTMAQRSAYTYLHRLVFRLKRIIEKVPVENKKFVSYAAAFALIREYHDKEEPLPTDYETRFLHEDVQVSTKDVEFVENFMSNKYLTPFKLFCEEMGTGSVSGVPANNIATTPGISLPDPPKLGAKKILRRKKDGNIR